jgi:hypothetical protein
MGEMGVNPNNFIIHQKEISVLEAVTAATNYRFDLYEVPGGQIATEVKLNRNDAFFIYAIGLNFVQVLDTSTLSNSIWRTFPDPAVFAAAGQATALEAFNHSLLTFKTVPNERIVDFSTINLRYRPTDDVDGFGPSDSERGFFHLSGEVIVSGEADNAATLSLFGDADIAAAVQAGETTYLALRLLGHIVQNGAKPVKEFLRG